MLEAQLWKPNCGSPPCESPPVKAPLPPGGGAFDLSSLTLVL